MSTTPTTDDLVDFARFALDSNPSSVRLFWSTTEQEFIDAVEGALLHAIVELEKGRAEFCKLQELGLSKLIASDLRSAAIPASAEEHTNGHVDLTIKHPRGRAFFYLGECKIWKSIPYHLKGVSQLLNDYSTGRQRRGCCVEFVKIADTAGKLEEIREDMDKNHPLAQKGPAVDHHEIKGGFITCHRHVSGWDVEVLHFGCNLFQPASPVAKSTQQAAPRKRKKTERVSLAQPAVPKPAPAPGGETGGE